MTGTTDKATYAPGETVNVTINGGYRYGWVRTYLYDQNGAVLKQTSGVEFPVTVSAPAPSAAGTYTWKVAWYGNVSYNPGTMGAGFRTRERTRALELHPARYGRSGMAGHGRKTPVTRAPRARTSASPADSLTETDERVPRHG